jgi:hypothetical protein
MIRAYVERRMDCKQGKGRNKINPNYWVNGNETIDEVKAEIKAIHASGEEIAPGYMPIIKVSLYDGDAYHQWCRNGGDMPAPLLVLNQDEVAAL